MARIVTGNEPQAILSLFAGTTTELLVAAGWREFLSAVLATELIGHGTTHESERNDVEEAVVAEATSYRISGFS